MGVLYGVYVGRATRAMTKSLRHVLVVTCGASYSSKVYDAQSGPCGSAAAAVGERKEHASVAAAAAAAAVKLL